MKEIHLKIGERFNTRFGELEIIDIGVYNGHTNYKIKFLNTGNEKWTQKQYIEKDEIEDELAIELNFCNKIYSTKSSGEIYVFKEFKRGVPSKGKHLGEKLYKVKFLETENIDYFPKKNILVGCCLDRKKEREKIENILSKVYTNKLGEEFNIIKYYNSNKVKIKFSKTNYETDVKLCHALTGSVTDKYSPTQYKFYMGEGPYNQSNSKFVIGICHKMHHRCYNKKDTNYCNYGAKGVEVDERFHNIQYFCEWYYNFKEKYYKENKQNLDLDKDILSNINHLENKVYSPETCLLIPSILNVALAGEGVKCGVYRQNKVYRIDYGLRKYYKNFKEAKMEYAKNKSILWKIELEKYNFSKNIKKILLKYDFSWYWVWENMTEEEILKNFYNI